jgi:cell division protein FtsZ
MVTGMADEFTTFAQRAHIKVCGVGGGGGNAVNRMIAAGLQDVDFIVINTDAQALKNSPSPRRLQIGLEVTGGLGSGGKPEVGKKSAVEDRERLTEILKGADMVFLTAGLGGGTGTGAAPVVAEIAKSTGALTLGIVTLPFSFEGAIRMENALAGLKELEEQVNSLIVIPNDRVAALGRHEITFLNAFQQADEVLHNGVRAITQLIQVHGLWNVDFADFRTVMESGGRALMGIGRAEGDRRAVRAAEEAIVCPLLEQSSINGAKGVIVNIRGGRDIGMREVEEAVSTVKEAAHPGATLFVGAALDDEEHPELEVTVIAAGFAAVVAPEIVAMPEPKAQTAPAPAPVRPVLVANAKKTDLPAAEPVQGELIAREPARRRSVGMLVADDLDLGSGPSQPVPYKEDEDMGIPTWLRNRKQSQRGTKE